MRKRGVGAYQAAQYLASGATIIHLLVEVGEMRYKDIVEKTGLSIPTVSKHLKRLEEERYVEKKIDLESGEYPYPVYYRTTQKAENFRCPLCGGLLKT